MAQLTTKICVLGDFSVGKTSLVRRFAENRFDDSYLSTIGVRVSRKVIDLGGDDSLSMLVWDTAGGEAFSDVVRSYYRGSSGALLVCDLTRLDTVTALVSYADDFHSVNPGRPLIMMGNKLDLAGRRAASDEHLSETARTIGARLFQSSARTGEGVAEAFLALGLAIVSERNVG